MFKRITMVLFVLVLFAGSALAYDAIVKVEFIRLEAPMGDNPKNFLVDTTMEIYDMGDNRINPGQETFAGWLGGTDSWFGNINRVNTEFFSSIVQLDAGKEYYLIIRADGVCKWYDNTQVYCWGWCEQDGENNHLFGEYTQVPRNTGACNTNNTSQTSPVAAGVESPGEFVIGNEDSHPLKFTAP